MVTAAALTAQKYEELAQTPPMGWNTWNTFEENIDETLIRETAEAMIASGMRDAGYEYIVLDDAWMTSQRDADGNLVADPVKFPSGMKALGEFLHERGFKFGIYNCAGHETCAGFPGGRGHEYQDARLYASWGVDYLKYDWCNTGSANAPETYKTMSMAIRAAGRPMVLSLCEWGASDPWTWASDVGHLWRTTGDIYDCYDCIRLHARGWKRILDAEVLLHSFAGPGHWNDPDMLEVGNPGLTLAESRAHFAFWCILAAPLMAGNDVRSMPPEIRDILTNREAIAIDQDPLGKQGRRYYVDSAREIWLKQLSGGSWALCAHNPTLDTREISVVWDQIGWLSKTYTIRDIWQEKTLGTTDEVTEITRALQSHDVMFFRLDPVQK